MKTSTENKHPHFQSIRPSPSNKHPAANSPSQLFFDQLRDLYSLEVQLRRSMPHLVSLCHDKEICDLIDNHFKQNSSQIAEIIAIFEWHKQSPGHDKCKAMAGLIEGGTAHLESVRCPHTRDLMMVGHCLRIEYYEMAAYEFTTLLSGRLGLLRESVILSGLLAQEKEMAATLMMLEPILFKAANFPA